ncbi:MAG TPA: DUF2603 domain-containing protein [Campylobacterales bacterium]|nr:DUF2603 domain-containing protein [Campylobacterales bacterium]
MNIDKTLKEQLESLSSSDDEMIEIPIDLLNGVINMMQDLQKENFELKLEKSILQHLPTDFEDVKAVVVDKLDNNYDSQSINNVVNEVRKQYPNLFIDMKSFLNRTLT